MNNPVYIPDFPIPDEPEADDVPPELEARIRHEVLYEFRDADCWHDWLEDFQIPRARALAKVLHHAERERMGQGALEYWVRDVLEDEVERRIRLEMDK